MALGTVKWFTDSKGFGFITPDDGSEDLFAHFSAINMNGFKDPEEGEKGLFEVVQGPKGKGFEYPARLIPGFPVKKTRPTGRVLSSIRPVKPPRSRRCAVRPCCPASLRQGGRRFLIPLVRKPNRGFGDRGVELLRR